MNCRLWAITASVGLASLTLSALRATALPIESESTCYMKTSSGQVIDLRQSLCSAKPSSRATAPRYPYSQPASSSYSTGVSSVVTTVNGGVTTTIYSAPGYNSGTRYIYPSYSYGGYNSGRVTQRSSSTRY